MNMLAKTGIYLMLVPTQFAILEGLNVDKKIIMVTFIVSTLGALIFYFADNI